MELLFYCLGGLGMFLFSMKCMSDGLQALAGDKLRDILEAGTKTPIRGVLTGTLVTGLIQSSAATTVLAIGLVNARLMSLRQAIGVIMGANIGTTVTAFLIGFKLSDYSLPIVFVGAALLFFCKKERLVHLGTVILGFGLLFYGMDVMGQGLKPLAEFPQFTALMLFVEDNIILGVGVGAFLTAAIQSSSAFIGIMQELAYQGVMTYNQVVPMLFGSNIGTTVTALLAGLGTTLNAKRTSFINLLFNTIGTLIFLPLFVLGIFPVLVETVANFTPGGWEMMNVKMQIAFTHGLFNITNTLLFIPFVSVLDNLVCKLIPEKEEHTDWDTRPKYLEQRLLNSAPMALSCASREMLHMGRIANESLEYAIDYYFLHGEDDKTESLKREETVDMLEKAITSYVVEVTHNHDLDQVLSKRSYMLLQAVGDLERIGDHAENLIELTDYCMENKIEMSQGANDGLREMMEMVQDAVRDSLDALRNNDRDLAIKVIEQDDRIDVMEVELRKGHISRLNAGACSAGAGAVYLDILSNLERIGDHAVNLAQEVLDQHRKPVKNDN
ncbi:MAG: Na/Pi cotransporter family protein [Peptococcaceae bacterium]|nr:Na/Pi cotransporter family protein [Peptococcaceae bacterium]